MAYITQHKLTAAALGVAVLAAFSVSGYAYATGTDPVSLVKRLVNGDQVEVQYQGRSFVHGTERSYSDEAVTAFAELNYVWGLHFRANNEFTIPRGGIEHVSNLNSTNYHYPWIGTITAVDGEKLTVQKVYTAGDKAKAASDATETVAIRKEHVSYFVKGSASVVSEQRVGKLVEVFQDPYLRHETGSKAAPTPVDQFFVYELTHTLANIKEANQTESKGSPNTAKQGLVEKNDGSLSDICLNNGADRCDLSGREEGQGLYTMQVPDVPTPKSVPKTEAEMKAYNDALQNAKTTRPQSVNNPQVIPIGEMVADPSQQAPGIIMRSTEGKITSIKGDVITIKNSSGTRWTFTVKTGLVEKFAQTWRSPLKVGDRLGVYMVCSIYDLDNRSIDNRHIYDMRRY